MHEGRAHPAVGTDDIEAEAFRLERPGAKRVEFIRRRWVMKASTGQHFPAARPQQRRLATLARQLPA